MSDYIPQEIWFDIFSRLPIKTLLQIRCVSKSWYALISNPIFITTHINQTVTNNNTHLLLVRHYTNDPIEEHYTLHWDDETFGEYQEIEFPFKSWNKYFRVVGCCNGLICLSDDVAGYMHTMILWNPTIRKWVYLPRPRPLFLSNGPYMFVLGFGFDPKSNDYKVVRVAYIRDEHYDYIIPPIVEVYTHSTGSWRSISAAGVQYHLVECLCSQAVVNGAVHWLGYNPKKWNTFNELIVSFDIGDEVFGEMMLPDSLAGDNFVEAFGGLLSLFQYDRQKKSCCIWVMKEYGVAESWTKQFTIDLHGGVLKALGLRKNGELLLTTTDDDMDVEELISYDPKTQKVKDLGVYGATSSTASFYFDSTFYVDSYLKSLVLLKEENGILRRKRGWQANSCDTLTYKEGEEDEIDEQ